MKFLKRSLATLAIVATLTTLALAQSTANHFVYVKNVGGLLVGVIVHDNSFLSRVKIKSFCALQSITNGSSCEELADSSPFANDPSKAIRFVNRDPNVTPETFQNIQQSLSDVTKKLEALSTPAPTQPYQNTVSDAAVPHQLEGTDRNTITTTAGDHSTPQQVPPPGQPTIAPQFNAPAQALPDITALVNSAVASALSRISLSTPAPQPTPVTPSQVISSFFSGTGGGSANYIGYGSGDSLNSPNKEAVLASVNASGAVTGGTATFGNASITGALYAGDMHIASSSVQTLNSSSAVIGFSTITNATASNLYANNLSLTNASVTNSTIGNLTVVNNISQNASATNATLTNATVTNLAITGSISGAVLSGSNINATNGTITNSTSTNLFASFANIFAGIFGALVGDSIQVRTIDATSSLYALNAYASTSNASTSNAQNLSVSSSSTLASTTVSNITSTGNIAGQVFVGGTGSFTNLSSSASTTLGSTTASNLTSTGNLSGANLAVSGSSTIASTTSSNLTVTGSLAAAIFNAVSAVFSTLTSIIANIATLNAGTGNFTNVNATGTTQLTTVLASTSNASTSNITNLTATNATLSNATVTNSFATTQNVTNASVTNLTVGGNNVTTLVSNIATNLNTQTVNASTSNAQNLSVSGSSTLASTTLGNITIQGNAAVTSGLSAASSTISGTETAANLLVTGSSTLGSTTASNVSVTGNLAGNNIFSNVLSSVLTTITTLWGTTANFQTSNASTTNASTTNTTALSATNATATTLFASALTSLSSVFTSLIASTVQVGTIDATSSLYALNAYASTSNASTSNASTFNGTTANLATLNVSTINASTSNAQNLAVSGSSTLASTTLGNVTAGNAAFTSVSTGSTTIAGTATAGNLSVSGSSTISSTTVSNLTVTGSLAAAIFNAVSAVFSTLTASIANIANLNAGTGNFTNVNATGTTQLTALYASTTNASSTNFINATGTNATITNLAVGTFKANLADGLVWRGGTSGQNEATSSLYIADSGFVGIGTSAPTNNLDINQGTLTGGAQGGLSLIGTWNNAGTIFKGIDVNITNSNSNSNSTLLNLATGGSSIFKVKPDGTVTVTGALGVSGTTTLSVGGLDAGSHKIINLAVPTNNTDAVNKAYVDSAFASGVLWQAPVKTISTTTAPGSPSTGDRYLLLTGASGFGACSIQDIAEWSGSAWTCNTPATGTTVFVDSTINQQYNYNGSSWNSIATAVDHNSLYNLQGGQAGEYYHLNASQYSALNSVNAQLSQLQTTGTATQFVNLYLTGGINIAGTGATITNATFTNTTVTNNAIATNVLGTYSTLTNATATNLYASNASISSVTANSLFAAAFSALASSFNSLFAASGYFTNLYATTSYATTTNTTGLTTTGNLLTTGSSTLGSTTVSNETVTGNLAATVLNAISASIGSLFASTGSFNVIYASTTNASTSNAITMNATYGNFQNLYASTSNASSTNTVNLFATGSSTLGSSTIGNASFTGTVNFANAPNLPLAQGYTYVGNPSGYASATNTLYISSGGAVGVGTTTSFANASTLTINGLTSIVSPTADNAVYFNPGDNHGTILQAVNASNTANKALLIQPYGGNVGIGTTAPQNKFEVYDAGEPRILATGGSHTAELGGYNGGLAYVGSFTNTPFQIRTNDTERMRIDTSGNVGIGTTSPVSTLAVSGDITSNAGITAYSYMRTPAFASYGTTGNYGQFGFFDQPLSTRSGVLELQYGDHMDMKTDGALPLWFGTNGSERMRIDSSGNVGIGTTAPAGIFDVESSQNAAQRHIFRNTNSGSSAYTILDLGNDFSATAAEIVVPGSNVSTFGGANSMNFILGNGNNGPFTWWNNSAERMRLNSSGNLGIGTSAPDQKLSVNGAADNTTGVWSVFSDERLKTATTTFADGLDTALKFSPITFKYNGQNGISDTKSTQVGIIAQQVQQFAPYMISTTTGTLNGATTTLLQFNSQALPYIVLNSLKEIAGITGTFKKNLVAWLGDAGNGIGDFFAHTLHADILCLGKTCMNEAQLDDLLQSRNSAQGIQASTTNISGNAGSWNGSSLTGTSSSATSTPANASSTGAASTTPTASTSAPTLDASASSTTSVTPLAPAPATPVVPPPADDNPPAANDNKPVGQDAAPSTAN